MNQSNITGIILAGGKSSRMGKDKGMIHLAGKPLISYSIDALKPFCDQILISSNSENYELFGYPVYKDIFPDSGPMGGIYSCLLQSSTSLNLVLSCDMPLVSQSLIKYILDKNDENSISVPIHGDNFIEPLCASYSTKTIPYFKKLIGQRNLKLIDLINMVPSRQIRLDSSLPFYKPDLFLNINHPDDLERASALL